MRHSKQTALRFLWPMLTLFALAVLIWPGRGGGAGVAAQGNDPPNRVIFLHYDYMVKEGPDAHSHEPDPEAIAMVVQAFRTHGITLHIDPQHTVIPEVRTLNFNVPCDGADAFFDDLKAAYFHPTDQHVWHYVIFAHSSLSGFGCLSGTMGTALLGQPDFMVTLGRFFDHSVKPPVVTQAGVFMHELGHNLNLHHGGAYTDTLDLKPNYISVMNNAFIARGIGTAGQPGSIIPVSTRVDYSDVALPTLDESHLNEFAGVGAGSNDITAYFYPELIFLPGQGSIDWNRNGTLESDVQTDISNGGSLDQNGFGNDVLVGHDDWAYVHAFLNTPEYRNGVVRQNPVSVSCGPRR